MPKRKSGRDTPQQSEGEVRGSEAERAALDTERAEIEAAFDTVDEEAERRAEADSAVVAEFNAEVGRYENARSAVTRLRQLLSVTNK